MDIIKGPRAYYAKTDKGQFRRLTLKACKNPSGRKLMRDHRRITFAAQNGIPQYLNAKV